MDAQRAAQIYPVLHQLQSVGVTIPELLSSVLVFGYCNDTSNPWYQALINATPSILSAFLYHARTSAAALQWCHHLMSNRHSDAIARLTTPDHGWHFSATRARPEQLQDFRMEDMAAQIAQTEPELWSLVRNLLIGSPAREDDLPMAPTAEEEEDEADDEEDAALWEMVGDIPGEEDLARAKQSTPARLGPKSLRKLRKLRKSLTDIKAVVILSILMQHRDQHCNTLQSTFGMFLHSCNAPEKLIKVLAHMGLSISLPSVHRALYSLAAHSETALLDLGQTLLSSYGYDNFDAENIALVPTVEGSKEHLMHLTSGALFRLDPSISLEDLRCSHIVWDRSEENPGASDPRPFDAEATIDHLLSLHPEPPTLPGTLSRRGRFRRWLFVRTLCENGPPYFKQLLSYLRDPEPIEMLPLRKLEYLPFKAMDINQSKVSGNIDAIQGMYSQSGVGDPSRPASSQVKDISDIVTIFHGDLSTYERVHSAKRQRKQEKTPYNRLQSCEIAIGMFHFKMAAADGIWRILSEKEDARCDSTSFMKIVAKLRPDDSSRLVSNAKFRERHELIADVGTVLRLDAWRVSVTKNGKYESLESWAQSKPSLAEVEEVAMELVLKYTEGEGIDLHGMKTRSSATRDQVQANTIRTHHYLLLYEELSYAMNAGDIGRLETLLVPWILLFRATGKHKYGNYTLRFWHALYFIYPDGLRKAIRLSILVNPTGKPHHFRAIDWLIELLNLYTKDTYGGSSSNNTKARILFESILVLLFRSCHANFERNFRLSGLSFAHARKDMRKTYKGIVDYLKAAEQQPNSYVAGRTSRYTIVDMIARGWEIIQKEAYTRQDPSQPSGNGATQDVEDDGELTAEDLSTEGVL